MRIPTTAHGLRSFLTVIVIILFFSKGLCKCIYLSAWDEEHFCIMVETLTELSLGRETDTKEMSIKGDALADEQMDGEY